MPGRTGSGDLGGREQNSNQPDPAGESGSTLRFLLPIVGALGRKAVFLMQGRLPDRPLAPYDRILTEHGMRIQKEGNLLHCEGTLHGAAFSLPGNISSQYFSGLLMALPLLQEDRGCDDPGRFAVYL